MDSDYLLYSRTSVSASEPVLDSNHCHLTSQLRARYSRAVLKTLVGHYRTLGQVIVTRDTLDVVSFSHFPQPSWLLRLAVPPLLANQS